MRRPISARLAFCASLLALALVLPAAPAAAAESPSHRFLSETNGAPPGPFEDACAVALDSGGDRYVSDYYHDVVDVFGPSGTYLTQIAKESNGNGPCALAVDAAGHLYVDNWRAEVIRYTPSAYPPTATTTYGERTLIDPSGTATGVAVDPATGDLYVDDATYLAKFEAPVHAEQTPTRIGENTFHEGYGLARSTYAGTTGDLYVPDAASGTVMVFGPAGESLPAIDGAGTPQEGFERLVDSAVAVDPSDGHVFVADNTEHGLTEHPVVAIDEFNPAGAYRGQISRWITHPASEPGVIVEHALQDAEPPGLAIDPAGKVYVTSGNSDNSESSQLDKEGKPVEGSLLYSFEPTSAARTLEVTPIGAGVGTVKSEPAGINCGSACAAEYDEGSKVTLTATPDSHSNFVGWSGCGATPTPTTCQVTMSAARSVNAEFAAIPQRQLSVTATGAGTVASVPAGIDCGTTCYEEFNEGSTVLLLAAPAPHNRLASWSGECIAAEYPNAPDECAVTMNAAKSIEAHFEAIPQQTLTVEASGAGKVTSAPEGIDCGADCSEQFDEGASVTLTAVPAIHNQVAWSGCAAQPSPSECQVTMSEANSVRATFVPILHTVSVSLAGAGSVSADSGAISGCTASGGSCSGAYPEGTVLTLTAAAAAGSGFAGWSGGCGGVGPCHLTIEADTAVSANFAALPLPIVEPLPAHIALGKLTVKGATATLKLSLSGPGTLLATGRGLKRTKAHATGAGLLALPLTLNAAGRRALARAEHRKLKVKVTLTFTPTEGGAAAALKKTVTFKR